MVYFAEKISLTQFGNIWSCLPLSQVEKWPFCHFSPQNTKMAKNGQKKFSEQKIHFHHFRITIRHQICKNEQNRMRGADPTRDSIDMRLFGL